MSMLALKKQQHFLMSRRLLAFIVVALLDGVRAPPPACVSGELASVDELTPSSDDGDAQDHAYSQFD